MKKGLTLLEILVALSVLAIFTLALLAFTQNTLATNRVARIQAQLMEELKDAAGYLADTLQEAKVVLTSATVNGSTCTPPDCVAALMPNGTSCALRAYRLEARSSIGDDYKPPDPWADSNTRMLREYRLTGQSCTGTSFSNAQPYVVLDLVDTYDSPGFFAISSNPLRVTLNIRLKASVGSRILSVPAQGQFYTITIYPRNAQ